MPTLPSQTIGVGIERSWQEVYAFAARPESFAEWASGVGASLRKVDGRWMADGEEGPVEIRFTDRNAFGILDHTVMLPSGAEVHVPMRVVANGDGCEVLFTLFRQPEMTDAVFARDAEWISRDLAALKALLER
jgi:hypothetical protein